MARTEFLISRRRLLTGAAVSASGLVLSGCDMLDPYLQRGAGLRGILAGANGLTYRVQRALLGDEWLAKEFSESEIRQPQRPNGSTNPQSEDYLGLAANGFAAWRLQVDGQVHRPMSFSLDELRAMPSRTQITRHDCVEGWSCIAKWMGVPLAHVLDEVEPKPSARYVVFHCLDTIERSLSGEVKYYESIDLIDARHPQTILAYGLNDGALPVANGAPLRVRIERQLGYKMAKYIHRIELTDSLLQLGEGNGGYWEDRGYEWYAGI